MCRAQPAVRAVVPRTEQASCSLASATEHLVVSRLGGFEVRTHYHLVSADLEFAFQRSRRAFQRGSSIINVLVHKRKTEISVPPCIPSLRFYHYHLDMPSTTLQPDLIFLL
jgi:hypothetical protein